MAPFDLKADVNLLIQTMVSPVFAAKIHFFEFQCGQSKFSGDYTLLGNCIQTHTYIKCWLSERYNILGKSRLVNLLCIYLINSMLKDSTHYFAVQLVKMVFFKRHFGFLQSVC